ncbi:hypothetical protein V5799_017718 [Amblyomma americanum]|uniref:M13 family peptidase n=1 Tax=Amblyomma americanum TaxID=6943 RepID=A0AAQ4F2G6_AMBAM
MAVSPSKESFSSRSRLSKTEGDSISSKSKGRPPSERNVPGSEASQPHPPKASSPIRDRQTEKLPETPTSQSPIRSDHDKRSSPAVATPTKSGRGTPSKKRGDEPPLLPLGQAASDFSGSGEFQGKGSATPRRKQDGGVKTPQSRRTSLASERSVMSEHDRHSPFIVACSLLCVVAFLVIVAVVLVLTSEKGYPVACASQACVQLSDLLNASVNATVKPCDNFYKYVCGGFPSGSRTSVYREHVERFGRSLISIAADALVNRSDHTAAQKVAVFLRSCLLAVTNDDQSQVADFRRKLAELGVLWPSASQTPDVVGTAAKVFATFRVAPLLKIERSRDGGEGEPPYLIVGPGTVMPVWMEQRDWLLRSGRYEEFYMATVVAYTGQRVSEHVASGTTEIKKFLELDRVVLKNLVYADSSHTDVQRLGTMSELQALAPNIRTEAWQTVITKELGLPTSALTEVSNPDYLKRLNDLLGQIEEKDLHFYLGWCVVQAMGRLMSKSLSDVWYSLSKPEQKEQEGKGLPLDSPRVADCMQLTESLFGWILFQRFALTQAGPAVQNGVNAMAESIAEDLAKRLEAASWVNGKPSPLLAASVTKADFGDVLYHITRFPTEEGLDTLLANVSAMQHSSFFTNWITAASGMARVPKAKWDQVSSSYVADMRATHHFMAYDPTSESIRVPPYFPMVPVFHRDLTDGANYGALGTLLGAAAIHLLVARLSRNESLAAPLLAEAHKKLACYASGDAPRPLQNTTAYLLHRVSLAASLPVVWEAFRNLALLGVGDQRGLKNFASDKSFFVTMCYILCDGRDPPSAAAAEFACNAAVKNVKAFAVAFRCGRDAPMHPKKKCRLFGQEGQSSSRRGDEEPPSIVHHRSR